jgi:hypothetical protein
MSFTVADRTGTVRTFGDLAAAENAARSWQTPPSAATNNIAGPMPAIYDEAGNIVNGGVAYTAGGGTTSYDLPLVSDGGGNGGGGGGGGGGATTTTGTGEAITSSLASQYLKFLQSRTYGTGLEGQGTAGFGQLTPSARSQVAGRFQPRRTEFNLFGPGRGITTDEETDEVFAPMGTFGDFLRARPTGGSAGGYRTQGDINARVQNLRRLLADPTGGVGQSGFTAEQGATMRGLFADDPTRQMNAAMLGAGRGVNPYFRDAMRQGAESNYANFRANNPGVSWLDYANQVGLLGTPIEGPMYTAPQIGDESFT